MNQDAPKLNKLPFFIGDALLLALAAWLMFRNAPLTPLTSALVVAAVAIAAWIGVTPFIIEFNARTKLADSDKLRDATAQLTNLENIARQISSAGAEWQAVHQSTTTTVTAAEQIAEKMIGEARNFGEVLTKMNESEKNHLRLEVDKLRRAEGDWLGVVVRMLDHVHALHTAGVRSGQKNIIEQLSAFQNACRETTRRLGIIPILPPAGAKFDAKFHQLLEGETAPEGSAIADVIAPGYTFQGQILRLPVVAVKSGAPGKKDEPEAQLSLEDQMGTPAES
jgi:molecular chaperone GrpE (heat shock protein)